MCGTQYSESTVQDGSAGHASRVQLNTKVRCTQSLVRIHNPTKIVRFVFVDTQTVAKYAWKVQIPGMDNLWSHLKIAGNTSRKPKNDHSTTKKNLGGVRQENALGFFH